MHQVQAKLQPQSRPLLFSGPVSGEIHRRIEHFIQVFGLDADSEITHPDNGVGRGFGRGNDNLPSSFRAVFDRIAQQVADDRLDHIDIAPHVNRRGNVVFDDNSFGPGHRLRNFRGKEYDFGQIDILIHRMHPPGLTLRPLEQVVEQRKGVFGNVVAEALDIETGDLILFAAGPWEPSCDILGRVRLQCAEFMELLKDNKERDFLWVIEFPLVGWDEEEQRWVAIHHPFTRPVKEDEQKLLSGELSADLRAQAYDVVLNGTELGGGSIRIHERDLQSAMFKALGITEEQAREQFGHILDAFSFGAPPHGGLALGLDRLVMMICNAESIREVIAFPKNNRGADLMSDSPAAAEDRQLRDIHIQVKLPAKK